MTIPPVDSLWIDNDPRPSAATRYVLVTGPPDVRNKVPCLSWYDLTGGAADARPVSNGVQRFQPLRNGSWSRTGFRPADHPPVLGFPYGFGPDASKFTGSGS